ncbi:MAG: TonB-dependent receptor [Acidobacteria bacterium]|nr:TonB-dependent receptor [Acidobacteriota bacterium]
MERRRELLIALLVFLAGASFAQEKPADAETASTKPEAESAKPLPETETVSTGASKRNENTFISRIDTGVLKDLNVRLGDWVTIVEPAVDRGQYATEHGRPPTELLYHKPTPLSRWHGNAFEAHQNSVFNARTFFQVGPVQPSHQNSYGASAGGRLDENNGLSVEFGQSKIRGMVNGNVLVPLPSEHTPLATEPRLRAIVERFLAAYPSVPPNRTDFDARALNTNSPQTIDETRGAISADHKLREGLRLAFQFSAQHQFVKAFQLVAGQNPDTDVGSQTAKLSLLRESARGTWDTGFAFQRARSQLVPEPNAAGPYIKLGYQLEELGPSSEIPIDRAQNTFRVGSQALRLHGSHRIIFGGEVYRYQLNGIETRNQRPILTFGNNFGRLAIDNLRAGTPNLYEISVGELSRGFRNSAWQFFLGDTWPVTPKLQVQLGLRYGLETAPHEVRDRARLAYHCDCNNFSPVAGLAYALPDGSILRASYTISYGEIYPVTYQQARFNPPEVVTYVVANPDLVNPLAGVQAARSSLLLLDKDLVAPYTHQYNFSWDRPLVAGVRLRLGYVGSRTLKIPIQLATNRARPVPGIPLTTETVNERRPDPRYYEVSRVINNGIAYLDAAQAVLELPRARGLLLRGSYTFSKAIDTGADYAHIAANRDATRGRSQSEDDIWRDKKGLSDFDATHSLMLQYDYRLPSILKGWELSGATLFKSGTPLTLYIGSDAPGFGNVDGSPSDRPNILDPSILGRTIDNPNTAPLIMRRDRFSYITPGEKRGNLGRGTFRKDDIRNFNLALQRAFHLLGNNDRTLTFRAEAYNASNHPQFDEPQRNYGSPAFGKITNTLNDGRIFQLGLRFQF